jgi:hypothetical protein
MNFPSYRIANFVGYAVCSAAIFFCLQSCERLGISKKKHEPTKPEVANDTIAHFDFEHGIGEWPEKVVCCPWSAKLDSSVSRGGKKSLRFEIQEASFTKEQKNTLIGPEAVYGLIPNDVKEGWFAFSVLFPQTFTKDTIEESIVSWQSLPDFDAGEEWRSPPLLLGVLNDSLVLEIRSDHNLVTRPNEYTFERFNLGPVARDKWLDWVFHIKWAYDNTGKIEVWKNDALVFQRLNQPNSYYDRKFPYFKIGILRIGWTNAPGSVNTRVSGSDEPRIIFVDDITVGNAKLDYNHVHTKSK